MTTKSQILRKDQILSALMETRQHIIHQAGEISAKDRDRVFLGIWSVRDLLAHLVGWDHTNLDAVNAVMSRTLPAFYEYHDHDWKTYNSMLVTKYKRNSFRELMRALNHSHHELLEFLKTVPAETFNQDFGVRFRGYKVTIQRLLESETKDEQTHSRQIEDFFKESK